MTTAVSVLLPVRNGGHHLGACIRSLERQTLREVEFVVVDDGSDDETPTLLRAWARRDARVRHIRTPPRGIVQALEEGRAVARAPYIARMDADDLARRRRFELQYSFLQARNDLVGCGCQVRYFPRSIVRDGARRYETWINGLIEPEAIERDFFIECPLAHPTFFLRAEAVEAAGGYRDEGWPEDYDLLFRLRSIGGRFASIPSRQLAWREGAMRLSRGSEAYSPEAFRRCKVRYLLPDMPKDCEYLVWGAGPTGKAFAREVAAQGGRLRGFVDLDPRRIGQTIHGVPVFSFKEAREHRGAVAIAAVGSEAARREIRAACTRLGWKEGVDFRAVA